MRAIENGFSSRTERLDEVLENEHGGYVEAGERFVQDEHIGIVHKRGDQEDTLAHPFGIRTQRNMPMRKQGEKLEEGADLGFHSRWRHGAKSSNHLQIFLAGEKRIEIGLFRNVAESFSISYEIALNVSALEENLAMTRLEEAGEHFYRGTFSRAIGAQVPEHLARLQAKRDFSNCRNRPVELR